MLNLTKRKKLKLRKVKKKLKKNLKKSLRSPKKAKSNHLKNPQIQRRKKSKLKLPRLLLQKRVIRKRQLKMTNGSTTEKTIKKFERVFCVLFANQVNSPYVISITKIFC
jgi:hypothetical protein